MIGTKADLARFLGVNRSSITRAVQAGRIQPEADGRFDFQKCAAAWHDSMGGRADVAARHAAHRGADIPQGQSTPENTPKPAQAAGMDEMLNDGGRGKAKAALIHYENSLLKLEMALRRSMRYELAIVHRESHGMGAILRASVERLIDICAPRLAASGPQDRRRILLAEVNKMRQTLKREMPASLRRMRANNAAIKVKTLQEGEA